MKESLALPTQICVNVVAFLGKPNGAGERPITLTGCPYAVYMARYKNETRRWDDVYHGWWDDAVKGNSALQSGLLRRIYEEVATLNGQQSACSSIWKSSLTVCVCTNSSIRHWSGTFQNDCFTLLCKRISASESSVQGKWWSKAYSLIRPNPCATPLWAFICPVRLQTQVMSPSSASMSVASTRTTRQSPLPRTSIYIDILEHQAAASTLC